MESLDPLKTKYFQSLFLVKWQQKEAAAKSASGASMSKYDVEVEGRLQALEAKVAALEASDKAQQEVDARFLEIETMELIGFLLILKASGADG